MKIINACTCIYIDCKFVLVWICQLPTAGNVYFHRGSGLTPKWANHSVETIYRRVVHTCFDVNCVLLHACFDKSVGKESVCESDRTPKWAKHSASSSSFP